MYRSVGGERWVLQVDSDDGLFLTEFSLPLLCLVHCSSVLQLSSALTTKRYCIFGGERMSGVHGTYFPSDRPARAKFACEHQPKGV